MSNITQPYSFKDWLAHFGRLFALLLNRSMMYQADHPMVRDSLKDVMAAAETLLDRVSPLVFILNRGQFYVDEQVLDPRINAKRIQGLFKGIGLQSISFEKGLDQNELNTFCALFSSLTMASKADDLKTALSTRGVFNLKINHVVYKKVTADDQIVSREALKKVSPFGDAEDPESRHKFMDALLESILSDELAGTLNITRLLNDPAELSRQMIATDLAGAQQISAASSRVIGTTSQSIGTATRGEGETTPSGVARVGGPTSPVQPAAADAESADLSAQPGPAGVIGAASLGHSGSEGIGGGSKVGPQGITMVSPQSSSDSGAFDASAAGTHMNGGDKRGVLLLHQLDRMEKEVRDHLQGNAQLDLSELAQAILKMKRHLMEGLQAQKAVGAAYANEDAIAARADQLTDDVLVALIREEYRTGSFTAARLALLIRRLIPAAADLRRLLPQIKEALLAEGMPLSGYMQLIRELQNELRGEELVRVLDESAEAVGLDSRSVIDEIKRNPAQAAELIYLAAELRKKKGDENALTDILVEYVEQLAKGSPPGSGTADFSPDDSHLKNVMGEVESTILKQLRHMNIQDDVLVRVEQRLNDRMESIMDKMRIEWLNTQAGLRTQANIRPLSLLQMMEQSAAADEELSAILSAVRRKVDAGKIGDGDFSQIQNEIERQKRKSRESGRNTLPADVLTSEELIFILEKEIARCKRHGVPFAALAFSFVTAHSKIKALQGLVNAEAVVGAALEALTGIFREMDYIGQIGRNKMLVLLPMAGPEQAKKALNRVMHALHAKPLEVNEVPVNLRVAGVAAAYDAESGMDAQAFSRNLSSQLMDMVARVKSIQVLF
jgi:GGDEF domain-containing protein